MQPAICVNKVSKSYRLNEREKRGGRTLGETITTMVGAPFRRFSERFGRHGDALSDGKDQDLHWALRDVTFDVDPGEICAVIGPNGAGKSTLFKILSRITKPTSGYVEIRGRLGSLLEVGTGFHPELTGRENVFLNGAILGMARREIARKFDEIVAFAEIDQFIDMPVKRYSSGMHIRLAFAVAAHLEPDILLLDEVLSVGDAEFQKKSQQRIQYLTQQGITTLLISHALTDLLLMANRCLYIRHGNLVHDGDIGEAIALYNAHTQQDSKTVTPSAQTTATAAVSNGTPDSITVTPHAVPPAVLARNQPPARIEPRQTITALEVADAEGSDVIAEGDDLHVTVRYRAPGSAEQIHFKISVWNEHEQMLTNADARFANRPEFQGTNEGKAVCLFPAIPLKPGNYVVRATIVVKGAARDELQLEHRERVCRFSVLAKEGARSGSRTLAPEATNGAVVRLPFAWSPLSEVPGHTHGRLTPPTLGGANGRSDARAGPLILSLNTAQPLSIFFQYPDDPELPVNIKFVSPESTNASNQLKRIGSPSSEADVKGQAAPAELRREMAMKEPNSVVGLLDYAVRITTGIEFYTQYKAIFADQVYDFDARRPDPFIIDAGSQFGMASLYFKHNHPQARVLAFEPEPAMFRLLQENMSRNGFQDVTLINAGLGLKTETMAYTTDPITGNLWPSATGESQVQIRPLSAFVTGPVDFLKLSMPGQELAVLQELAAAEKLAHINEMAVVYDSQPEQEQLLGQLLDLLAKNGFRYLVHDLDSPTNIVSKPPFRLTRQTRWSCLIYARALNDENQLTSAANGAFR